MFPLHSGTWISSSPGPANASARVALAIGLVLAFGVAANPARAQLDIPGFSFHGGFGEGRMGSAVAVGDFNGDGFDDLAVGMPNFTFSNSPGPGALYMLYGGPGDWSLIEIVTPEELGSFGELGAQFAAALAAGDFDNDGHDDLAIGVPNRTVSSQFAAGQVVVVYGSPQNLDLDSAQFISQNSISGLAEVGDQFGSSLAAGDLSADGVDDLAIGVHLEDLPGDLGSQEDAGAVNVLYGFQDVGLVSPGNRILHEDSPGVSLNANAGEHFGYALAIGQFTGNSFPDLAVGVPGEIVLGPGAKGAVVIFPGAPGGIDPVTGIEAFFSQETPGILGTAEEGDSFGFALASGNFDGDLWTDLAIGVPGESELGASNSGAVQILYGGPIGITAFGDQFIVESSFDTDVDPFDRLGVALAAGDFNADGRDDLAIGAPLDNSLGSQNSGEVDVLYGTANGLTIAGGQVFNMIFFDTLEMEDLFGSALATGRFFHRSSKSQDLAVGVPGWGEPIGADPGAILVIRSRSIFADGFETGDFSRWDISVP